MIIPGSRHFFVAAASAALLTVLRRSGADAGCLRMTDLCVRGGNVRRNYSAQGRKLALI
jgi:hypothetical protein